MQTSITIAGAEFFAYHGYYEEERIAGNRFLLDIHMVLSSPGNDSDQIRQTINYEDVYKICQQEMNITQKLLETVVYRILYRIREEFGMVSNAQVTLSKINPQLGGKVEKVAVMMRY
ncbi:MAG TPA: dihydroneopterin aldolase [Saprospiraceae bacterium]|nr:dihydroneopterin aldolase [Saprospiraceae bacterium]